jgi:hypothetical protein
LIAVNDSHWQDSFARSEAPAKVANALFGLADNRRFWLEGSALEKEIGDLEVNRGTDCVHIAACKTVKQDFVGSFGNRERRAAIFVYWTAREEACAIAPN